MASWRVADKGGSEDSVPLRPAVGGTSEGQFSLFVKTVGRKRDIKLR
ncbi:MAG: hypothetical protein UX57_C0010G0025 [Candidatus Uhrbacteria bacterium GW2011_GWE2_46_68]|uniref:Uncharacterized protein n=2 Tax=Candidatus Uhriibacteriota TaxID=1752732 RepID=A0A0G1Q6V5_9BACT|nr:MAG: hypothetical protein UX45_C0012G0024 [Candidatus Uhrbacteria bacterium GW2011_GWF2_46_218]KKU40781.1 MAG: hypothetical protein UX57_C0010G0025 [Candidatus Uhrbacteria bacterium GW2011_GWE2_46_68]